MRFSPRAPENAGNATRFQRIKWEALRSGRCGNPRRGQILLRMIPNLVLVRRYAAALLVAMACSGCDQTVVIRGRVFDVREESLPGVAITVSGAGYESLSNTLGDYTLWCAPGELELNFVKSGYTPGRLHIKVEKGDDVTAADVKLWPLPPRPGVYLYENLRYTETTRIEPRRFRARGGGEIFATKKAADLLIEDQTPQLIAYKLPSFDAQIYRMEQVEAQQPEASGSAYPEKVWAPVESIPVLSIPMDEPGHLLLELQLARPLEHGTYAVHWGVLDGHRNINETARLIFLFRVIDPEEEEAIRAEQAEEAEREAERRRALAEAAAERDD